MFDREELETIRADIIRKYPYRVIALHGLKDVETWGRTTYSEAMTLVWRLTCFYPRSKMIVKNELTGEYLLK